MLHQTNIVPCILYTYSMRARTTPPTKVRPQAATFDAPALVEVVAAADAEVDVEVFLVDVVADLVMMVVETLFVAAVNEAEEVIVLRVVELAVVVTDALLEREEEEEDEELVYAVPVESWIVLVDVADWTPFTTVDVEPERPVMWNGNEYWKTEVSVSRVITKP